MRAVPEPVNRVMTIRTQDFDVCIVVFDDVRPKRYTVSDTFPVCCPSSFFVLKLQEEKFGFPTTPALSAVFL